MFVNNAWSCDNGTVEAINDVASASGAVFLAVIQTLLAAHCAIVTDKQWPRDQYEKISEKSGEHFDFIIIGSGSAGSVLANRLSENGMWRVLLVEAGGDPHFYSEIPLTMFELMGGSNDWSYMTEPSDKACQSSINKQCFWPRGKAIGGSSTINGMFYVRGDRSDFDEWSSLLGNKEWSYDRVLPYFKKSENIAQGMVTGENIKYHGVGGNIHVERYKQNDSWSQILIDAYRDMNIQYNEDINGESIMGVTKTLATIKDGRRQSIARAYLTPAKDRENMVVLKNTFATRLIYDDNNRFKVVGVTLKGYKGEFNVYADREVIISAGAVNTPPLLMNSGIGPREHLESHGIPVISNLPVGKYLQDHIMAFTLFKTKTKISETPNIFQVSLAINEFLGTQTGPAAGLGPTEVIAFRNTKSSNAKIPDIQHHHVVLTPKILHTSLPYFRMIGLDDEMINLMNEINEDHTIVCFLSVLLKPRSMGEILLNSSNPIDRPIINHNYLDKEEDVTTLIDAQKFIAKFETTETFKRLNLEHIHIKLKDCLDYEFKSDGYYECLLRHIGVTLYHAVGTARMGTEPVTSVVNDKLFVHGFDNLRVIDASIMPTIPRGNTNAATIMIGEKGAEFIINKWSYCDREHCDYQNKNV